MLQQLRDKLTTEEILAGIFGLEREMLRVNADGTLAKTPHPSVFGDKQTHPFITTDFAENQIELITPACESIEQAHHFLTALYDIVATEIQGEQLWPQSMPAHILNPADIVPATFEQHLINERISYRDYLLQKYGPYRQIICGIHYNFSFADTFFEQLYEESASTESLQSFKDECYLKIVRNYMRYHWLLIYLLGASPTVHESYECELAKTFSKLQPISLRNSACGYENKQPLMPSYQSVEAYCQDLQHSIDEGLIQDAKEYYNSIRLKPTQPTHTIASLREDGIHYLEIRTLDLNPFEKSGVALTDLTFLHRFLLFCLVEEERTPYDATEALCNKLSVATDGLNQDLKLSCDQTKRTVVEWGSELLTKMIDMNETLGLPSSDVLHEKLHELTTKTPLASRLNQTLEGGYLNAQLSLATTYQHESKQASYQLVGYEDLELSTQILLRECLKYGVQFELLDRADQFVKLQKGMHVEYVKQATKTNLDTYATVLAMENKVVTKKILAAHHIVVPRGEVFTNKERCKKAASRFIDQAFVVKPNSTNFGLGISIFNHETTVEAYEKAVDIAFSHDSTVIVESFLKGREYRLLVIEDRVVGVLHRVPANVKGDGQSTIEELVAKKNEHPWRGTGYTRPLEKIKIDESAKLFLAAQQLSQTSVLARDQVVYLRENSNISTGGDSLDLTDDVHQSYKDIAIQAAHAIGAKICGVDMMIETIHEPGTYGIIELNFNPAIHIHTFPYQGVSREPARYVLQALGFISAETSTSAS